MNFRKLAARALTLFPAIVIAVAALFQAHALASLVRAKPLPDAVMAPDNLDARWSRRAPSRTPHHSRETLKPRHG